MRDDSLVTRRHVIVTGAAAVGGAMLVRPDGVSPVAAQESTPVAGAGQPGGEIKIAYNTPATLNPLFSTAGVDQGVERQMYGALVAMTHETRAADGSRRIGRHLRGCP